ncbi:hypothetical protein [Pseudochryseolinea flava]|uniref:Uncharacterized protein n=1 Tax=Pseudochryseolinea flava TaxID=2059302 RepID=A0A364Y4Z0_9BACT|nr:hypothetical protein [Pseudochryseolinea flava]RAW00897.1 hypothetical protein DQQ10_11685 [Pseudochryseolinea flava]
MKTQPWSQSLVKVFTFLSLLMCSSIIPAYAGGEYYEVYLNDKLILQQGVTGKTIQLKNIPIENANANDRITIIYKRCHDENATGRKLTVRDEAGNILKEWKFPDRTDERNAMTILVKDLVALNKKGATLNVAYSSEQLTEGRTLVALSFPDRKKGNF